MTDGHRSVGFNFFYKLGYEWARREGSPLGSHKFFSFKGSYQSPLPGICNNNFLRQKGKMYDVFYFQCDIKLYTTFGSGFGIRL